LSDCEKVMPECDVCEAGECVGCEKVKPKRWELLYIEDEWPDYRKNGKSYRRIVQVREASE